MAFCKLFFPHYSIRTLWHGINSLYILTQCIVRQSEDKCPSSVSPETLPSQSVHCCILVLLFLFHTIMKPNDRRCYVTKCVTFIFCILWNFEKEFIYQKNWMYLLIHVAMAFNSLLHFAKIKFYPHKNMQQSLLFNSLTSYCIKLDVCLIVSLSVTFLP